MSCQIQLNENVLYVLYMCEIHYAEKYEYGKIVVLFVSSVKRPSQLITINSMFPSLILTYINPIKVIAYYSSQHTICLVITQLNSIQRSD